MNKKYLNVVEIYETIDGEISTFHQGRMTTIIRLAGCNFSKNPCSYCDSLYDCEFDMNQHHRMEITDIILEIEKIGNKSITITGGEPLLQQVCLWHLLHEMRLSDYYSINIETNGSIIPTNTNTHSIDVEYTCDYKLPSSGNFTKMMSLSYYNFAGVIKFIIADEIDYKEAIYIKRQLGNNRFYGFSTINFSDLESKERFTKKTGIKEVWTIKQLYERLKEDKQYENVNLNLQLHKIIGLK